MTARRLPVREMVCFHVPLCDGFLNDDFEMQDGNKVMASDIRLSSAWEVKDQMLRRSISANDMYAS